MGSDDKPEIQVMEADTARQRFSHLLQQLEADCKNDFAIVDELRAAFRDVSASETEAEAERALKEVRQEHRRGTLPES